MKSSGHWLVFWEGLCAFIIVLLASKPTHCTLSAILQAQTVTAPKFETGQRFSRQGFVSKPTHLEFNSKSRTHQSIHNSINVVSSSIRDVSSASIQAIPAETQKFDLFKHVQGYVSRFIAPAKDYADLINRYHKWFIGHESIRKTINHPIMEAMDVFKLEYAKVQQKLLEEEVKKVKISTAVSHKIEETENLDVVFKILKQIIGPLEANLKLLEENEDVVAELNLHPEAAIENEETVREAIARVERSFVNHAKSIIKQETFVVAKKAAFTGLAMFMEAKPDTGDFLDHLRPVISILACASTPLAVSYLQDIQFRASLAIVTHSLEAIIPISKITEMLENSVRVD